MEWQKCPSFLKAWGGWTRIPFAIHLVQNVIQSKLYGQPSLQKLWFNCRFKILNLAAVEVGPGCHIFPALSTYKCLIVVGFFFVSPLGSLWGCCPSKHWCDCIKYVLGSIKQAGCCSGGLLFSLSAGACLCLPWTSLVQSVIVAVETFHLQTATSHQHKINLKPWWEAKSENHALKFRSSQPFMINKLLWAS